VGRTGVLTINHFMKIFGICDVGRFHGVHSIGVNGCRLADKLILVTKRVDASSIVVSRP
jgi:hypothetical protein